MAWSSLPFRPERDGGRVPLHRRQPLFFAYLLKFRNMYRFYLLYCLFLCLGNILFAQTTGFEKGVPQSFCTVQSNELSSSEEFYKEGKRSLAWQFSPRSVLTVKLDTPLHLDSISKEKRGITLWITTNKPEKIRCAWILLSNGHGIL